MKVRLRRGWGCEDGGGKDKGIGWLEVRGYNVRYIFRDGMKKNEHNGTLSCCCRAVILLLLLSSHFRWRILLLDEAYRGWPVKPGMATYAFDKEK